MIRRVTLRRFKRFESVTFDVPGHIVLAGPNNCGKTTLLQAVACWSLALGRWKELNDFQRHGGAYTKAPIARHAFYAVPLRAFDSLWNDRDYHGTVEIEIADDRGWTVTMELLADSTEQIYVRPKPAAEPDTVRRAALNTVFVPAMGGLSIDEPVYQRPKIEQLLGQGKPGDVIRNLLWEAHQDQAAWNALDESIGRLFHCRLLPPDVATADIIAQYEPLGGGPRFDIASAGSGFQQVLMLLTFLHTRPSSVLLLDEPDAHMHVILQDAIYAELRSVAAPRNSQLIVATHSEVIINSVDPAELCSVVGPPRLLASTIERKKVADALGVLTQLDILRAEGARGVLYLENFTDLNILREWARILRHPLHEFLTTELFWRPTVFEHRPGARGVRAREHYDALRLVRDDLPGLELVDGDADPRVPETPITGQGLQRLRWRRYEVESYLVHPAALERFVAQVVGGPQELAVGPMRAYIDKTFTETFSNDPFAPNPLIEAYFEKRKARTEIIPPILEAAGIHGFPYTRFHQIAALMEPDEIHPEVKEKLDLIQRAFRL
ncbi:MAG TPA: AAA family ATPase [Pirellulales bacterium]|jgi:predicted ATPase|nr:AAA family ATPase [Pirellulales bacterium]